MSDTQPSVPVLKVRWSLLGMTFGLGAGFVGAAVVADVRWQWQNIWPSVLLEVGASLALAGILFLIERALLRHVREESRQEAQRVVADVEARANALEQVVADQQRRINDLTAAAGERRQQRLSEEDEQLGRLADEVTLANVREALALAHGLEAIWPDVAARCTTDLDGPRMHIYVAHLEDAYGTPRTETWVSVVGPDGEWARFTWVDGSAVDDLVDGLHDELNRHNHPAEAFDPTIAFNNLLRGLRTAVQVKRGQRSRRLEGRVIEVFDDDLVITTAGIESLTHGKLAGASEFPVKGPPGRAKRSEWQPPTPPAEIDPSVWAAVVGVASRVLPIQGPSFVR